VRGRPRSPRTDMLLGKLAEFYHDCSQKIKSLFIRGIGEEVGRSIQSTQGNAICSGTKSTSSRARRLSIREQQKKKILQEKSGRLGIRGQLK